MIVSPTMDLSELQLTSLENAIGEILEQLQSSGYRDVILDFRDTDYYGSSALGFFIKLWKRIRTLNGDLVFCNVSPHEREVLELTRLDRLWTICATRDEAVRHLHPEKQNGL